jgi:hypothetical protein
VVIEEMLNDLKTHNLVESPPQPFAQVTSAKILSRESRTAGVTY